MPRGPAGPVGYLLPAGDAGRRDDRVVRLRADGGEQAQLADAHRQLVMLRLEAERPGHSAAAGVDLDDLGARDAAQQRHGDSSPRERLLMAVPVEQDPPAAEGIV